MTSLFRPLCRVVLAAVIGLTSFTGAVQAEDLDLSGQWQADNGESRYELNLCGDGTQLCADLVWIRPQDINDRNKQYIGKRVVDEARLVSNNPLKWRGKINVYGNQIDGTVTMETDDRFIVKGCALLVFCVEMGANRMTK